MFGVTLILILYCIFNNIVAQNDVWFTNVLSKENRPAKRQDLYFIETNKDDPQDFEKPVDVQLYYECHCPDCIDFDRTQFKNVVKELNHFINIKTYPYGNAQTIDTDGKLEFVCQHGPQECYGNKLHACALKHVSNHTEALLFNICMMEPNNKTRGSDDEAVERCSKEMNLNKRSILICAKSEEGNLLLKYYGEESEQANLKYVPYVLIDGSEWKGTDLKHDICVKLLNPPQACKK